MILAVSIGTVGYFLNNRDQKKIAYTSAEGDIYYTDGTLKLAEGGVNWKLDDLDHKIYNHDRTADIVDGTFSAILKYQQNLPGITEYAFILMVDFKQVEFEVDGVSYRNYRFSLEGEDECQIEFKLTDLSEDAHEMEYIIFTEPDCTELSFTDEGWENIYMTEDICAERLLFSSSKGHPDDLKYIKGIQFSLEEDENYDGASLSKYKEYINIFPKAESGNKAYFFIGNPYEEETEFVAVAFCNWEQINILPDEEGFHVKIPPHELDYYELDLPEVNEDSPYQIVMFSNPYENVGYFNSSFFSTTRTIIRRKD